MGQLVSVPQFLTVPQIHTCTIFYIHFSGSNTETSKYSKVFPDLPMYQTLYHFYTIQYTYMYMIKNIIHD